MIYYVEGHDVDEQLFMEEDIAYLIFERQEDGPLHEDACGDLAGDILMTVLAHYRPDLVETVEYEEEGATSG